MKRTKTYISEIVESRGRDRTQLLPVLQEVVEKDNFLSENALLEIADELSISPAEVYGTASFYAFLSTKKVGKYAIRVCKTITCSMKGSNQILLTLKNYLKINFGETTPDNRFTLLDANCLGWCHKGPAMLINDKVYTELTPERVKEILSTLP